MELCVAVLNVHGHVAGRAVGWRHSHCRITGACALMHAHARLPSLLLLSPPSPPHVVQYAADATATSAQQITTNAGSSRAHWFLVCL